MTVFSTGRGARAQPIFLLCRTVNTLFGKIPQNRNLLQGGLVAHFVLNSGSVLGRGL